MTIPQFFVGGPLNGQHSTDHMAGGIPQWFDIVDIDGEKYGRRTYYIGSRMVVAWVHSSIAGFPSGLIIDRILDILLNAYNTLRISS